jgi:hypothetical protein
VHECQSTPSDTPAARTSRARAAARVPNSLPTVQPHRSPRRPKPTDDEQTAAGHRVCVFGHQNDGKVTTITVVAGGQSRFDEERDVVAQNFPVEDIPRLGNVLMLVCNGLKDLPDAGNTLWDKTIVQTYVVHLLQFPRDVGRPHGCPGGDKSHHPHPGEVEASGDPPARVAARLQPLGRWTAAREVQPPGRPS